MLKYAESDNTKKLLPSLDLKGYSSQEKKKLAREAKPKGYVVYA